MFAQVKLVYSHFIQTQKDRESIVAYGSRLEQTLSRAIRYGHIELAAKALCYAANFGQV